MNAALRLAGLRRCFENIARQAIAGLVTAQSMLGVKRPERGIHAASTHEVQKTLDKTDALGRRMLKRRERRASAAGSDLWSLHVRINAGGGRFLRDLMRVR